MQNDEHCVTRILNSGGLEVAVYGDLMNEITYMDKYATLKGRFFFLSFEFNK
ncbi:8900_t:CDS:2 [Funneliformis geosporum]|nr:8900_t:CDS:2 [Funneliformis geosporum]